MRKWIVGLVIALAISGVLYWRFGSREVVKEETSKPETVKPEPELISGFGPEDLYVPRPEGTETVATNTEEDVEGVASVPTTSPDTAEADTSQSYVDLAISRRDRPFEEFYRYRGGIDVSVVGDDPGALYAPQPRALVDLDLSFTAGASLSLRGVGVYASASPVRVWGFRPAWFAGYGETFSTGPGVHFDVLPRLSVGGYYDLLHKQPHAAIGYRF